MDETKHNDRTRAASTIYNSIPLPYRQLLDRLVCAKVAIYPDREDLAHPPVKKSELAGFLAPFIGHQTNAATDLLKGVQDLQVLAVTGEWVPMFVEG